jgi:hypothetical protein
MGVELPAQLGNLLPHTLEFRVGLFRSREPLQVFNVLFQALDLPLPLRADVRFIRFSAHPFS